MSKMAEHAQDFLENGGKSLGYDERNLPKLGDMTTILLHGVHIWEYNGMSEEEYYGGMS